MKRLRGTWRDAFESLSPEHKVTIYLRAYETVARLCDHLSGLTTNEEGEAPALFAAAQLLKAHEVYVRKARRYQCRQREILDWTVQDLSRTLAWKAKNEVLDHLRKIRRGLVGHRRRMMPVGHSDERHKSWLETIISYFEGLDGTPARDAADLIRHLLAHPDGLRETPKRGVSFKAGRIAAELTKSRPVAWDDGRVQRARMFIVATLSEFEGETVAEVVDLVRQRIA